MTGGAEHLVALAADLDTAAAALESAVESARAAHDAAILSAARGATDAVGLARMLVAIEAHCRDMVRATGRRRQELDPALVAAVRELPG